MVEVVAGVGFVVTWLVLGFLLGLGFVGVVLLGALLLAAFRALVRRRPLRVLLAPDTAGFAHGWAGKVLVAAVLLVIPATMVLLSLVGGRYGRYGRYGDDSWKALLMRLSVYEPPRVVHPRDAGASAGRSDREWNEMRSEVARASGARLHLPITSTAGSTR